MTSGEAEAHVLVVDDDAKLRALLSRYLTGQGFRVTVAEDAREARDKLRFMQPDAMVLDVTMPGESGLALTESLRAGRSTLPVILLTASGAPEDRIRGFESGADDYLGKPFEPRELVLRLRAMLRRTAPAVEPAGPVRLGPLEFDPARLLLTGPEGAVHLTGGEAQLLSALARRPGETLSREEIAEALRMDDAGERAIDVQVTRLRRKIEHDPREPRFLQTVRGRGYALYPGL